MLYKLVWFNCVILVYFIMHLQSLKAKYNVVNGKWPFHTKY